MIRRFLSIFSIVLLGIFSQLTALENPHVKAELISEVMSIQPGQPFWVAVHLTIDPEWHTYWKNPGDSGLATRNTWSLPEGFKAGDIHWPEPQRIEQPPLTSFGYQKEAYLLVQISPPVVLKQSKDISIKAHIDWLECKEACYPGRADLKIDLPVAIESPVLNPSVAGNFSLARFQLPLRDSEWKIQASQDGRVISIVMDPPPWFKSSNANISFFPTQSGLIENSAAQKVFETNGKVVLMIPKAEVSTKTFEELEGVLVANFGWLGPQTETALAIKMSLPHARNPYSPAMPKSKIPFWIALLCAFIGGMILNLMPCVLPVLSIKVMGFLKQGDQRQENIKQGLLYLGGVLVSFWILAGVLLFLRKSGESVGWGFQLQSPTFVAFLAGLFFVMALNLFGLFEIGLSLTRLGDVTTHQTRGIASFLSGVLATIVATPCTAPFMGSALGYALTVGPAQSMLVFSFLGLGMGVPYVALAAFPNLLSFVPKPGPWMDTFKQSMGFLFSATVVWLLWVLERQGGLTVSSLAAVLLLLGLTGWGYGKFQRGSGAKLWGFISVLFLLLALGWGFESLRSIHLKISSQENIVWQPYSEDMIQSARSEGRPVFIDFSAAWCLTCQVNEKVAFSSDRVIKIFKENNIATFKADWTSKDDKITQALNKLGRNGVPVYAYYHPGTDSTPVLLPEILTPQIVIDAIKKSNSEEK